MKKLNLSLIIIFCTITVFAQSNNHSFFASNQTFSSSYEIKNSFDTVTRLGKIRTSCTCADVKYLKSELQPGESTELIVTLKANSLSGPGFFADSAMVFAGKFPDNENSSYKERPVPTPKSSGRSQELNKFNRNRW